jgi:hypothetical protein
VHFGLNDIRDLPRLEEFGDLIGENINDDLVAAIQSAEPVAVSAEEESVILSREDGEESPAEEEGDPSTALGMTPGEVGMTVGEEESQLESQSSDSAEEE